MKKRRRPAGRGLALLAGFVLFWTGAAGEIPEEDWQITEIEDVDIGLPVKNLLAADLEYHTPNENSPVKCSHAVCSWNRPMGLMDEASVWEVLTAPVTVLAGNQRQQCRVRKEPAEDCTAYTGLVTYESQGVHVLERGEEWTLIEAYSSAPEGASVKVYATLFQGYVKTELLKEVQVDQTYGIVIDKQQQRMYLFRNGEWWTTLLVSTGYAKKSTPWNETPAGEYLMISWTGDFWSGDLFCQMAMRINDGILIHEVPCKERINEATGESSWSYDRCERYLGEKASHGCIRVQRQLTPEGVNEKWLWDHLPKGDVKKNTPCVKVLIWDDAGRTLGYPDDDLPLYYNPKKGTSYHSQPTCSMVSDRYEPMTEFRYGELDQKPYSKLTRCPACAPQLRKKEIDQLNEKNNR